MCSSVHVKENFLRNAFLEKFLFCSIPCENIAQNKDEHLQQRELFPGKPERKELLDYNNWATR